LGTPGLLPLALAMTTWGSDTSLQSTGPVTVIRQSSTYRLEEAGTTATLSYQHGFVLLVGAISLVVLAIGLIVLRRPAARRFGAVLSFCGGLFVFIAAPGMWNDRVVITPTEIRQARGVWFLPQDTTGFRYSDVASISIRNVRKGRSSARVWLIAYTSGIHEEIDPGDLWADSEDIVVERLRGYGVQFNPAVHSHGQIMVQPVIVGLRTTPRDAFGLRPTARFGRFDTIYVLVPTVGTTRAAVLGARWFYQTGELLMAQMDTIAPRGTVNTEFHIMKRDPWPVGRYWVEISLDGRREGGTRFEVVP
jgi:hypothetical protein